MRLWSWLRRNTLCRIGGHHWDIGGMTALWTGGPMSRDSVGRLGWSENLRVLPEETTFFSPPARDKRGMDIELIEMTMQHHLGVQSPDGWVLCLCCQTFKGPVFHRRHVASLIAAGEMCEPECRHPRHGETSEHIDGLEVPE